MSVNQEAGESLADGGTSATIRQLSMDILSGPHYELLDRAITRILSTEIAEETYAQIVDGVPLGSVAYDHSGVKPYDGHKEHPVYHHTDLVPGALDKTKAFRARFSPETLKFDARVRRTRLCHIRRPTNPTKLLYEYQAASAGSRAFNIKFIEIIAIAIHQIAVILFVSDVALNKDADEITRWAPPKSDQDWWAAFPGGPGPTLFYHAWYMDYDRYPNGIADVVGYWAESRIFGGVVMFDRRQQGAGPDVDPGAIYLHPDRARLTYRIYKLLPEQRKQLFDFLTADQAPSSVLPIMGDEKNTTRVDPEESSETTGIYRDIWERLELPADSGDLRLRDVCSLHDYVTFSEFCKAAHRGAARKWRLDHPEDPDGYWRGFDVSD